MPSVYIVIERSKATRHERIVGVYGKRESATLAVRRERSADAYKMCTYRWMEHEVLDAEKE